MKSPSIVPKKRCAMYTRKSSEEGLDQEYNSLEAQRDAAMAFVVSQKHEGWIACIDHYDDGGFSGGNMERPALKRLLADIEARRVDVIVVYKIDRLSRSLADFAKMVELFDAHGVTFVSVTQQFNTTTSMGRLTLNILLSFAQFEREVTGERIRDKIAASKAKGMWMGGTPPLGYDVKERKLIVNEPEAELVRQIFVRFVEQGSIVRLVRELEIEGRTTKAWTTQTGKHRDGRPIDQQYLFALLRNRLYLGEMVHKGHAFPGQHQAIVSPDLWDAAHAIIDQRKMGPRVRHTDSPALLAGLLHAGDGQRMLPTYTQKPNGKRYRYYMPYSNMRRGANSCSTKPLPAAEIEAVVLGQVHQVLQQPEMVVGVWQAARAIKGEQNDLDEALVFVTMRQLGQVWEQLFPTEQHRIMRLLIERVQFREEGLDIVWRDDGWQDFAAEMVKQPLVEEQRSKRDEEILL
jgi:DNA invertase Pin-like site-specific DNA recombinase